jgi:hypothetical protein
VVVSCRPRSPAAESVIAAERCRSETCTTFASLRSHASSLAITAQSIAATWRAPWCRRHCPGSRSRHRAG